MAPMNPTRRVRDDAMSPKVKFSIKIVSSNHPNLYAPNPKLQVRTLLDAAALTDTGFAPVLNPTIQELCRRKYYRPICSVCRNRIGG